MKSAGRSGGRLLTAAACFNDGDECVLNRHAVNDKTLSADGGENGCALLHFSRRSQRQHLPRILNEEAVAVFRFFEKVRRHHD